jgi:digeranylgeranylglycerophospholipid reductase
MSQTKRSDVIVIGGGPSGLRAAGRLACHGLDVRLLERKPRVGQNVVCTGIVSKEVFSTFGLNPGSIIRELRSVRLVSPFTTTVSYEHPESFAFVVDRETFDGHIAEAARAAGAALDLGAHVEGLAVGKDGVTVMAKTPGGSVRHEARVAVIASGVGESLQKQAGLGYPRDFLRGAQVELAGGDDPTTIYFGKEVAAGGFGWSVPARQGRARVGLLTHGDARSRLLRLVGRHRPDAAADLEGPGVRTKAVAQGLVGPTAADRVISVGEAAGQIKTTTGGGISYGLMCADMAADVIADGFARSSFGAGVLGVYEDRWRRAIRKEIVVGYYTRKMCARLSDGQVENLFHLAQTDGIIPIIKERADFDWHSGLIMALLQRLSFMRLFRGMKARLGQESLS